MPATLVPEFAGDFLTDRHFFRRAVAACSRPSTVAASASAVATGAGNSIRATAPSRRRSSPSGSIAGEAPALGAAPRRQLRQPVGLLAQLLDQALLCVRERGRAGIEGEVGRLDPVNAPEAGDEMGARHRDAIEMEIGEVGVERRRRMAGDEARLEPGIVGLLDRAEHRHPRPGQRIDPPGRAVDQQRRPRDRRRCSCCARPGRTSAAAAPHRDRRPAAPATHRATTPRRPARGRRELVAKAARSAARSSRRATVPGLMTSVSMGGSCRGRRGASMRARQQLGSAELDQRRASFGRLRMRTFLRASKTAPHPEPVEGRRRSCSRSFRAARSSAGDFADMRLGVERA